MSETTDAITTTEESAFEMEQRRAKALAESSLVPKEYRGNVANTLIAMQVAKSIGMTPFVAMSSLHIINGRPSWSATMLIATANACGRFTPLRFKFDGEGDDLSCYAFANDKETGDLLEGAPISIGAAKAAGWYGKGSPLWKAAPRQQLAYRAASLWVRLYAPEIGLGLYTADEMADTDAPADATPASAAAIDGLRDVTPPEDVPEIDVDTREELPPSQRDEPTDEEIEQLGLGTEG